MLRRCPPGTRQALCTTDELDPGQTDSFLEPDFVEAHTATGLFNCRDPSISFVMALRSIPVMAHLTFGSLQIAFEPF